MIERQLREADRKNTVNKDMDFTHIYFYAFSIDKFLGI